MRLAPFQLKAGLPFTKAMEQPFRHSVMPTSLVVAQILQSRHSRICTVQKNTWRGSKYVELHGDRDARTVTGVGGRIDESSSPSQSSAVAHGAFSTLSIASTLRDISF